MEKKKRLRVRRHEWFISPGRETETNEKLAAYLWQEGLITEGQKPDRILVDNKPVYGWLVPHRIITQLEKASKVFTFIKFGAYKKEGDGKWKKDNFLHKKGQVSVHSKAAQARLKETGARKK